MGIAESINWLTFAWLRLEPKQSKFLAALKFHFVTCTALMCCCCSFSNSVRRLLYLLRRDCNCRNQYILVWASGASNATVLSLHLETRTQHVRCSDLSQMKFLHKQRTANQESSAVKPSGYCLCTKTPTVLCFSTKSARPLDTKMIPAMK